MPRSAERRTTPRFRTPRAAHHEAIGPPARPATALLRRKAARPGCWRPLPALLLLTAVAGCERASDPVEPASGSSAAAITVVSGGGQPAFVGTRLEEPIVFRALDAGGRPVPGIAVDFVATAGSGRVEPGRATTDQNGDVSITWAIGPDRGVQTLLITAGLAATAVNAYAVDLETELEVLFAPPTAAEIAAVRADWADRDVSPAGLTIELTEAYPLFGSPATLRVVSHLVGEVRHYGAIVVPKSTRVASLPVLMYLHGGDNGVDVDDVQFLAFALGELRDSFVYVIPSFRSEPLRHGDREWVSTGPGGHWDHDVDDALALLNVALALTPQAKPEGLSLLGGSRGGGVALLAGIRDERVENIITLFGPTDFFDEWVREIVREAALGMPRQLTGVAHMDSTLVQPYMRGLIELARVRLELVRRSAVLFAEYLPAVQLHHGVIDETVSVSQAHSMIRVMEALGREPPEFEAFIYEGAGHEVFDLSGVIPRAAKFLRRALGEG